MVRPDVQRRSVHSQPIYLPFLVISSSLLTDRLPVCSGATWSLGRNPGELQNGGAGENSITRFNNGSWDGYIMMMRCENEKATPGCKDVYASISFSKDLLTWTPRTPVPGLNPWIQVRSRSFLAIFCHVSVNVPAFPLIFLLASQGAADQNSVLGVKGGLVFTHGGCTPGSRAPACLNATGAASTSARRRLSGGKYTTPVDLPPQNSVVSRAFF